MSERRATAGEYRRTSPWPVLVALGLALSELGVFVGLFPVAVVGLVLFGASVAGALAATGYVDRPLLGTGAIGVFLLLAALAVAAWRGALATLDVAAFGTDPVLSRVLSVAVGGALLLLAAVAGALADSSQA